jgi:tRNA(fMet)-specific endonuclease VapC
VAGPVVVDSDLVIDFLRGKGQGRSLVRTLLVEHRLRVTAVTAFELRVGTDFLARREEILRLLNRRTLPLDLNAAVRGGEVAATLRRQGQDIGFADCLQAGVCLRHDLPLATRNRKHFSRVEGLQLADLDA